jgi:hypothetical protein
VNVFTEVVPRVRRRTVAVPPSGPEAASPSPPSLLDRRLAGRLDLDLGTLRHLRDSLTLAIPSRQVIEFRVMALLLLSLAVACLLRC